MKIASWNVNSIKARKARALSWFERVQPDVVALQEIKAVTEKFPESAFNELGFRAAVHGQPTYNGVAILAKHELSGVRSGMDDVQIDEQARVVAAEIDGISVLDVYVPNGGSIGSDKWKYKLEWLDLFLLHLESNYSADQPLIVLGDFNIAPDDDDVAHPEEWGNSVLCDPQVRDRFERLIDWGLNDTFRKHHPDGGVYSWWDYRQLAFPKGNGLRIDLVLSTDCVDETSVQAWVDRDERKGEGPSDHAPVVVEFDW